MIDFVFKLMNSIDESLWSLIAIPMILVLGIVLSFRFNFVQVVKIRDILYNFFYSITHKHDKDSRGVHPMSVFFASIGGCIGIGNIVGVCTAIQIGGPGAVFWVWIAAFLGAMIKYSEVYLGVRFRVHNQEGGYDGGPMYYLQRAFRSSFVPILFSVLLAVYGTEIYMFNVITHSIVENWHINHYFVIAILLALVLYATSGGLSRVGRVSSMIIPFFLILFSGMSIWVLLNHISALPSVLFTIISSAFKGHAPLGGFAGSGIMLTMSQGIARGCYTGDIGVGYAGIVNAGTRHQDPVKQARLSIVGIFLDTFVVCTLSTLLIIVTGVWNQDLPASLLVQRSLETYFPYMNFFMPLFLFLLGYSSLIAFFCAGLKCAKFIHPGRGAFIYYIYATVSFIAFSFMDQRYALTIMSIAGATLLVVNLIGIFKLRKEVTV